MEFLKDFFILIGRICLGGVFLWAAYEKIRHWHRAMEFAKSKHVPNANIVLPIAVALKIVGGLLVVFGWHAHIGALLLLIVAIPSLLKMHPFWRTQGPDMELQKHIFMKEVAVIGGLLILLAIGAGHIGLGHGG